MKLDGNHISRYFPFSKVIILFLMFIVHPSVLLFAIMLITLFVFFASLFKSTNFLEPSYRFFTGSVYCLKSMYVNLMYKNLAFCTTTNDVLLFCKFSLTGLPTSLSLKMPYTHHSFCSKITTSARRRERRTDEAIIIIIGGPHDCIARC